MLTKLSVWMTVVLAKSAFSQLRKVKLYEAFPGDGAILKPFAFHLGKKLRELPAFPFPMFASFIVKITTNLTGFLNSKTACWGSCTAKLSWRHQQCQQPAQVPACGGGELLYLQDCGNHLQISTKGRGLRKWALGALFLAFLLQNQTLVPFSKAEI